MSNEILRLIQLSNYGDLMYDSQQYSNDPAWDVMCSMCSAR